MSSRARIDVTRAADRRRFYLQRALRKNTRGAGSDLRYLMSIPPSDRPAMAMPFEGLPAMLIGAHAASAYAPERMTKDVDFLVPHERFGEAEARLREAGWEKRRNLFFPNAALGLYGSAWTAGDGGTEADLISSPQPWVDEAFAVPVVTNRTGERVIPLPFLVLMKLDSARSTDQGDLQRMLGLLGAEAVEEIIAIVERHYGDPAAADDLRQYHEIGRWEYDID